MEFRAFDQKTISKYFVIIQSNFSQTPQPTFCFHPDRHRHCLLSQWLWPPEYWVAWVSTNPTRHGSAETSVFSEGPSIANHRYSSLSSNIIYIYIYTAKPKKMQEVIFYWDSSNLSVYLFGAYYIRYDIWSMYRLHRGHVDKLIFGFFGQNGWPQVFLAVP